MKKYKIVLDDEPKPKEKDKYDILLERLNKIERIFTEVEVEEKKAQIDEKADEFEKAFKNIRLIETEGDK